MTREQMIDAAVRSTLTFPGYWKKNLAWWEKHPEMLAAYLPEIRKALKGLADWRQPRAPNGRFIKRAKA